MNVHLQPEHDLDHTCWCHPRVVRYGADGEEIVVDEGCPPLPVDGQE